LGLPEVSLGIIPGYGGTQRLPRIVGEGRALELILTGDPITADRAYEIGLVNGVFAPEELSEKVASVAVKILSRGPIATALAKEAVYRGGAMSMEEGLALESDLFGVISSTDEMREGLRAFLDKRDPSWKRKPS
jgi:enoyl-CoA hydratase